MHFTFEALKELDLINGSSYLMDFGEAESQEDAIITEGKLLTVFGAPAMQSDNCENSFEYVIRASADNGQSVILSVYGVGVVHVGAHQSDDLTMEAARALISYVSNATPSDFERTVYYLDFNLKIDISLQNGEVILNETEISEEEAGEIFQKWFS